MLMAGAPNANNVSSFRASRSDRMPRDRRRISRRGFSTPESRTQITPIAPHGTFRVRQPELPSSSDGFSAAAAGIPGSVQGSSFPQFRITRYRSPAPAGRYVPPGLERYDLWCPGAVSIPPTLEDLRAFGPDYAPMIGKPSRSGKTGRPRSRAVQRGSGSMAAIPVENSVPEDGPGGTVLCRAANPGPRDRPPGVVSDLISACRVPVTAVRCLSGRSGPKNLGKTMVCNVAAAAQGWVPPCRFVRDSCYYRA